VLGERALDEAISCARTARRREDGDEDERTKD
jgi:hypothetical protein